MYHSTRPVERPDSGDACLQRFQEIQSVRRTLLERAGAKEGKEPECSDQEWAEAAQEPSTKALGAALTRGQRALAALIQSYTPAINKFATEYTKKVPGLCIFTAVKLHAFFFIASKDVVAHMHFAVILFAHCNQHGRDWVLPGLSLQLGLHTEQ